jgi:hypothetical protein
MWRGDDQHLKAVGAALIAAFILVLGCVAAVFAAQHAVAAVARGEQLAYLELLALWASNWYVRAAPAVNLAVLGAAAILAGRQGRLASLETARHERRGWIIAGAVAVASDYALLVALNGGLSPWWSVGGSIPAALFVVSCFGALVATIRIRRLRRTLSTR